MQGGFVRRDGRGAPPHRFLKRLAVVGVDQLRQVASNPFAMGKIQQFAQGGADVAHDPLRIEKNDHVGDVLDQRAIVQLAAAERLFRPLQALLTGGHGLDHVDQRPGQFAHLVAAARDRRQLLRHRFDGRVVALQEGDFARLAGELPERLRDPVHQQPRRQRHRQANEAPHHPLPEDRGPEGPVDGLLVHADVDLADLAVEDRGGNVQEGPRSGDVHPADLGPFQFADRLTQLGRRLGDEGVRQDLALVIADEDVADAFGFGELVDQRLQCRGVGLHQDVVDAGAGDGFRDGRPLASVLAVEHVRQRPGGEPGRRRRRAAEQGHQRDQQSGEQPRRLHFCHSLQSVSITNRRPRTTV